MFLKRILYASASILMLALAYHLGAVTATAQTPGNPIVAGGLGPSAPYQVWVVTANGDVYGVGSNLAGWTHVSNVFGGSTPTQQPTWGQLKAGYRH